MLEKLKFVYIISFLITLSACNRAPSQNILGSYFPAWMLCAFFGIILTVIAHIIFAKIGIEEFIPEILFH